ncbi:MAG: hypothetical protein SGBAC_008068, partial [Bacillariaceae sp.]
QFPEDSDIVTALQRRFLSLPLHALCYEQAYESSEETLRKLKVIVKEASDDLGTALDCFGMTPLHVLSLSQRSNTAVFEEIMKLRLDDLMTKDKQGKLPLHYVCLSDAPVETFRLALDTHCAAFPSYKPDWKTLVWITETVETYKYAVRSSVEARDRKMIIFIEATVEETFTVCYHEPNCLDQPLSAQQSIGGSKGWILIKGRNFTLAALHLSSREVDPPLKRPLRKVGFSCFELKEGSDLICRGSTFDLSSRKIAGRDAHMEENDSGRLSYGLDVALALFSFWIEGSLCLLPVER